MRLHAAALMTVGLMLASRECYAEAAPGTPEIAVSEFVVMQDNFEDGDYTNNPMWAPFYANVAPGSVTVVSEEVRILRTGAGSAGRTVGMNMPLNYPVTDSTLVRFDVKPTFSNVPNGSGIANTEFPANVIAYLTLLDGTHKSIRYAYNYRGGTNMTTSTYIQIANGWAAQNVWLRDEQFRIREHFPTAVSFDSLKVNGAGWDFESWFDNISIRDYREAQVPPGGILRFEEHFADGEFENNPTWIPRYSNVAPGFIGVIDEELRVLRTGAGGAGRTCGPVTFMDFPVSDSTTVWFDVKATFSNVRNGSGDANTEFPANVSAYLTLDDGSQAHLRYSYNYRGGSDIHNANFIQIAQGYVPQDEWLFAEHMRIREHFPTASRMDSLRIYGAGWDFESWYDNIYVMDSASGYPTEIDNDVVYISFDHDWGCIDAIRWKTGSNQELLDQYWLGPMNSGLGRIRGLAGCTVEEVDVDTDNARIVYSHPTAGTREFLISWAESTGVGIDIMYSDVPDMPLVEGGVWEPGGNNDGNDRFRVLDGEFNWQEMAFTYPGPSTSLFNDSAWIAGFWDEDYDEIAGYFVDNATGLSIGNGASADGPFWRLPQGESTLHFAVKTTDGFWDWARPQSDAIPPAAITDLQIIPMGNDAVLDWSDVTQNLVGDLITGVSYIVLFEEELGEDWDFLAHVTDSHYTHHSVVRFSPSMLYRVVCIRDLSPSVSQALRQNEGNLTWKEVQLLLK